MSNIGRAKSFLKDGATFALVGGDKVITCNRRGIAPLLEFAESGKILSGFSVADKIVGKAAAMLYVLMGAEEVYAEVMSRAADGVFARFGVAHSCETLVDFIVNRRGDGVCPMENAVKDITQPAQVVPVLRATLNALSGS